MNSIPQLNSCRPTPWRGSLAARLWFTGVAVLASGCAYVVPIPTAYHPAGSRRNLTEATPARFAPGTTTVDDVVLALGEPDEATDHPLRLIYRWQRINMHLSWGWGIGAEGVGGGQSWDKTYSHRYSVDFEFDEAGRLQTVQPSKTAEQTTITTDL